MFCVAFYLAFNTITGEYYNRSNRSFCQPIGKATLLTPQEMTIVNIVFENVAFHPVTKVWFGVN